MNSVLLRLARSSLSPVCLSITALRRGTHSVLRLALLITVESQAFVSRFTGTTKDTKDSALENKSKLITPRAKKAPFLDAFECRKSSKSKLVRVEAPELEA